MIAEWIAEGEPSLDLWEMDVRRFGSQYSPSYTHARIRETYETYYDIRYPEPRAQAGRPLVSPEPPGTPSTAPRSARSRAGSGSTGTSRTPPRATSRFGREAGRASTGRPRSAPSIGRRAKRRRSSTRARSRSSRSRARRPRSCWSGCATTASPARSASSPTRRCSTGAAGSSATSPSPGWGRSCSRSSPAPPSATTIASGSAAPSEDGGAQVRDVTSAWACFGIWGPRARDCSRRSRRRTSRTRPSPTCPCERSRRQRAGARAARHLRRRARLGDLLSRRSTGSASGGRSGRRGGPRPRRRRPRDRLAAAREGLSRLGRRHHARRDSRGGRRLLRQARQGRRVHRPRGPGRGRGARSAHAAVLPRARRPALGGARERAGPDRRGDPPAG